MRLSTIPAVLGLCGAMSACGSASMKDLAKEVQAGAKQAEAIQKGVEAAKKGDLSAAGDAAIGVEVKAALARNDKTRGHGIEVEVKSAVVTLKGNAPADAKVEAEKVAREAKGVSKVVNHIKGAKPDKLEKPDAKPDKLQKTPSTPTR